MEGRARLPVARFAFPGPLRDALVAAILDGTKTATSSLRLEYEQGDEPLPEVGDQAVVVDSLERPVAVIETTDVRVLPVRDVDLSFAIAEGEGFTSVAEWRSAHAAFWESDEMRAVLRRPDFRIADDTLVVCERFRVLDVLPG